MDSSINFLVVTFWTLAIGIFGFGFFANYGEMYLSPAVLYLFRYGRANITKVKMGALKRLDVPKSWFSHFYIYSALVQTYIFYTVFNTFVVDGSPAQFDQSSYLNSILTFMAGNNRSATVDPFKTVLLSYLFFVQVIRRLYETAFVSVYSTAKMNVFHYLIAFYHYSGSMLSLLAFSPGYSGSPVTEGDMAISWSEWTMLDFFGVTLGLALFAYGSIEQYRSHVLLASLRKNNENDIVSYSHQIPRGGLFELISCPNYWTEMIIYFSLALISGFQNPCWNAVTAWVICNQITAGVMNHIWYNRSFPNYPKERRAVIPLVW